MSHISIVRKKNTDKDVLFSELDSLINGSIIDIRCSELDSLVFDERVTKIITLFKKISDRGTLTLRFLDYAKISNDYLLGKISSKKLSEITSQINSAQNESDIYELVAENPKMRIIKSYHDNNDVIVVIEKRI